MLQPSVNHKWSRLGVDLERLTIRRIESNFLSMSVFTFAVLKATVLQSGKMLIDCRGNSYDEF